MGKVTKTLVGKAKGRVREGNGYELSAGKERTGKGRKDRWKMVRLQR